MVIRRNGGLVQESLTHSIIAAFFATYNSLGEGFLESVYAGALERELLKRGHAVVREFSVEVFYEGEAIARQRLDMVVDEKVVIEIKATSALPPNASRQLLNYLRATRLEVGLLLHFGPKPRHYREYSSNTRLSTQKPPVIEPG